jgi:hypothetical protein
VGVLRGAAAGQTVDLLQFQASNGTVLGAVTSAGNLKVASSVDVYSAGTLSVGTSTATAITVGKAGITTTIAGALTVNEAATFNENVTVAAGKTLRITGDNTAGRPVSPAEGTLYFDTTTKQLLVYANGKWQGDRSTATKIVAATNSSQAVKDAADYVADGTGDQAEINSALTAAAGGSVYLAEGTYTVSSSISVPNNTKLQGAGDGTLLTIPNSHNTNTNIIVNSDTTTGTGVHIQDLRIDGNSSNQSSGTYKGIYLNGMGGGSGATARQGAKISNITVDHLSLAGNRGIEATSTSHNNSISNSSFGNQNTGILVSGTNNSVIGNVIYDSSFGLQFMGANNTANGNTIHTSDNAIDIEGGDHLTITGNTVSSGGNNALYTDRPFTTITGNTFIGASADTVITYGDHTTITGNTVNGGGTGIAILSNYNTVCKQWHMD